VAITTSFIAVKPHIPETGLKQSMLHFDKELDARLGIVYVFEKEVKAIFKKDNPSHIQRPAWPKIEPCVTGTPEISIHSEVSIQGSYAVIEDIWLNFMKPGARALETRRLSTVRLYAMATEVLDKSYSSINMAMFSSSRMPNLTSEPDESWPSTAH